MDKPTKPSNLMPRSFGGVKNNFSSSLQNSGFEDGVPAIYGGDNLNYQLDTTGKELDYCEKICDYINAIPINKTPIVDANNKLVYTQYDIRVYNTTETYYENDYISGFVNDEKHIYRCKQDNVTGQSLSDDTYFERVDIMGNVKTIGRNIGELVSSTLPLTDAGLHLLDGALLQYGSYQAFIDYIAELYGSGDYNDIFETEANWQTAVTTYGVCGKFVYDNVNNTVRLPKITGIIEGTTDITTLCDLVQAGLPNITGTFYGSADWTTGTLNTSGAFKSGSNVNRQDPMGADWHTYPIVAFDASRSSSIYGNSNTVQPQTIKVLYYIVIATSTKTDIQVDVDQIAADLNGKADVDLTNVNNSGTSRSAGWAMPSNTFTNLTVGASGTEYTAPANGYIVVQAKGVSSYTQTNYLKIESKVSSSVSLTSSYSSDNVFAFIPIYKNDKFKVYWYGFTTISYIRFYYAVGSEREA